MKYSQNYLDLQLINGYVLLFHRKHGECFLETFLKKNNELDTVNKEEATKSLDDELMFAVSNLLWSDDMVLMCSYKEGVISSLRKLENQKLIFVKEARGQSLLQSLEILSKEKERTMI